ncbi:MAG: 8-amino-7-oxononanoate synthase [Methylococcales bacterium]|nr:8-amino-7-oxononanoate synthase [Methylococcales bacterium]
MSAWFSQLAANLEATAAQGLYRARRVLATPQGSVVQVDGNRVVNFCSNDYLGLANHPDVVAAFQAGANCYGVGSGSAHLICGHSAAHHALEEELAAFTGRDRALLFSTGYMANVGIITALLGAKDAVFEDRLNHASLLDGGLMSGATFKRYAHGDVGHLQGQMAKATGNKLIVTDGVFSMDGDFAPLPALVAAAKAADAWLMVDDAHGLGTIGNHGGGILDYYGLNQDDVPMLMGTLGKGLGTSGAFVAGPALIIETLIQKARTYIYTTAMPAAVAEATRASLKIASTESWRRDKLQALASHFRAGAGQLGLQLMPAIAADKTNPEAVVSAIQPILVGDSERAVAISNALLKAGFWVSAIRPPTVPVGGARLRVTFSALHETQQVDGLLDALATIMVNHPPTFK